MNDLIVINAMTSWHLCGAESYILSSLKDMQNPLILVFIQYHPTNGFRVSASDSVLSNNDNYRLFFVKEPQEQNKILSSFLNEMGMKTNLIMISPRTLNLWQVLTTRKVKNRKYIIINEGIGNFYSKRLWKLESEALGKRQTIKARAKEGFRAGICRIICSNSVEWSLLQRNGEQWIANNSVCEAYNQFFRRLEPFDIESIGLFQNDIVLISDNISLMISKPGYEKKLYTAIYKYLRDKLHKRIWFKPHPNECKREQFIIDMEDIGYSILKDNISSEVLFNRHKLICCGFCSTSLLTISLLLDGRTLSFVEWFEENSLNTYGRQKVNEFKTITSNIDRIERLSNEAFC